MKHGVAVGVCSYNGQFAGVGFASEHSLDVTRTKLNLFNLLAVHFNLCFLNLTSPLAKPVHAQDFPLTAQQHEVLKWIASGLLPYQVADKLAITKKTVDFHLENIYRKLGVCSRSQAISKALQIGLVHSYPEILEMS